METKLCKHCQTEIPKKAKVCPNCKKKQGGIGKWIVIVGVVIILIGAMGSSNGDNKKDNPVNNSETTDNNMNTNNNTDSNVQSDSTISAGGVFEANGLKVTVNEINIEYTGYDNPYGMYSPKEGYKYVSVSFTYENTGKSDAYVSIYDYDCYADGTLCEQSYYFDTDFMNANLSSGRNVSFTTYYEVPIGAEKIELEYTSNIWTDEKVIITVQ